MAATRAGKRPHLEHERDPADRGRRRKAPLLDQTVQQRAGEGDRAAQAVLDVASGGVVQAKMAVGAADDPWERAADQAADAALRRLRAGGGAPPPTGDDAGSLRRSAQQHDQRGGGDVSADEEQAIRAGGGQPLPERVLHRMEEAFGADLAGVRIHDDDRAHRLAAGLQATAFTAGSDIWFAEGAYDPSSARGERVLAHELAHVLQQGGIGPAPVRRRLMSAKQFKASTRTDWHQRGDAVKAIDKHFAELERLKAAYDGTAPAKKKASSTKSKGATSPVNDDAATIANLERRIKLLAEMEDMAQRWIDDHMISTTLGAPGGPAPAPGAPAPAPARHDLDDPKRKRRMDGMRVLLKGGAYTHEKNKADKEIEVKSGVSSLASERQTLELTLLSLKGSAGSSGATPAPVGDTGRYKKIKEKYEGNAKSMFTKLSPIVNAAVPNPGDAVEVDLEAKIPVEPNAVGFVLFHLVLSANRDSVVGQVTGAEGHENVVLRGELTAGAGVNVADFLEFKAELGVYAESSANTAAGALTLMSYGVYRRWRESSIVPPGLVSYMYSGRKGEFGYQKSEAWANQVEKEQFSDTTTASGATDPNDAYVETGVLGRVSGKAGKAINGIGTELEASLTFGGGRRYNKESIERAKGAGNLGARNKTAKGAEATSSGGPQALLADDTFYFEIATGFNVSPVSGGLTIVGKFGRPASTKRVNPNAWSAEAIELQLNGAFTMPMAGKGAGMASKVVRPLATALTSLPGVVRTAIAAKKKELGSTKETAAKGTGTAMDIASASVPTLSQYVKQFGATDNWTNLGTDLSESTVPTVGSNLAFDLSIGFDFVEKELAVEFATEESLEVEIPLFFSGSVSKRKRILAITFDGGKPKVK